MSTVLNTHREWRKSLFHPRQPSCEYYLQNIDYRLILNFLKKFTEYQKLMPIFKYSGVFSSYTVQKTPCRGIDFGVVTIVSIRNYITMTIEVKRITSVILRLTRFL